MDINPCGCRGNPVIEESMSRRGMYQISCMNCGISTVLCYDVETAIDKWNKSNPAIANAEQAIRWLYDGKKITTPNDNIESVYLKNNVVYRTKIKLAGEQCYINFYNDLFKYEWSLCEEYAFNNTFEEAIIAFGYRKLVSTILDDIPYYIQFICRDYILLRADASHVDKIFYKHKEEYDTLKKAIWTIDQKGV